MWRIKQIFEDVIYTILDDISSRPVMSMHISCASLLSKYNNYYTIEGINNMLQQIKKQFNFHSLLNFARTILWDSLKRRFFHSRRYFPCQNTSILFIDIQTERPKYLILISLITCLDRKLTAYLEFCRLD